eukprot:357700-Chlamydomonas_euryale.AAC.1
MLCVDEWGCCTPRAETMRGRARKAAPASLAYLRHDCDAVAQDVCLLHGVRGEHNRTADLGLLDDVPHVAAADGVHASGRLIQ